MNSANKTLINILLGLIVAVVVGISANSARGDAGAAGEQVEAAGLQVSRIIE